MLPVSSLLTLIENENNDNPLAKQLMEVIKNSTFKYDDIESIFEM